MTYDDLRIRVNSSEFPAATRVSVNYPTQISQKRNLGANISEGDQFRFDGPSEVKLSIDFLLNGDAGGFFSNNDGGFGFLFDSISAKSNNSGEREYSIGVGGLNYQKCLLDDYSITVDPFGPVRGSVNFTSYDAVRGGNISANSIVGDDPSGDSIIHGYNCEISGANEVVSADVVSNLSYSKTFGRTPIYNLGDVNASSFLIDSIEAEMKMTSTGLESLLGVSGNEVVNDIVVEMESSEGGTIRANASNDFKITIPSGSRVVAQDFGVQGGDSVATNVTIKNVIL